MELDQIDKTGLIREAYNIEGITIEECRSIFLDWALRLPAEIPATQAITALLDHYAPGAQDHPMTQTLTAGLETPSAPRRRGGFRRARSRDS